MKYILKIGLFLLLNLTLISQEYKVVHQATVKGQRVQFTNLQFVNKFNGYASGGGGYFAKTTNGGDSWFSLKTPDSTNIISKMSFYDNDNGLILKTYNENQLVFSRLFKTSNGGITWQQVKTPNLDGANYEIKYNTIDNYFLLKYRHLLHKTLDGGNTWQVLNLKELISENYLYTLRVKNKDTIYTITSPGNKTFKSFDGGESWEELIIGGLTDLEINSIFWDNEGDIIIANKTKFVLPENPKDTLAGFVSNNEGLTWKGIQSVETKYDGNIILKYGKTMVSLSNTLEHSRLSVDNGTTWNSFHPSYSQIGWNNGGYLLAFSFSDEKTIFASADPGSANSPFLSGLVKIDLSNLITSTQETKLSKTITLRESGGLGILSSQNEIVDVICYDVLGNVVQGSVNIQGKSATILKSQFPNGVYYLQVRTSAGTEVVPFVNVR